MVRMEEATESAVLVNVPAAEAVVGPYRARLDPAASVGVPAHVTVLYPFVPPSDLDTDVVETLTAAIATVPRFRARFETTGWFDTSVLWLDPQPADRFRALTSAVVAAFPDYPPYGGAYDEVTPHLTVGDGAETARLREIEPQVRRQLPIGIEVTAAALWVGGDAEQSWREVASLPLG
jgi:2'-5' RNA ligase superfamily